MIISEILPVGRQTVSISCSYWLQIMHLWYFGFVPGALEKLLLYAENLPLNLATGRCNLEKIAVKNCGPYSATRMSLLSGAIGFFYTASF